MVSGDEGGEDKGGPPKEDFASMYTTQRSAQAGGVELKAGEVFAGRYTIEARIGQGGAGSVYRAKDGISKKTVALKVIRRERLADIAARDALVAEAVMARDIRHPNVVAVYDVDVDKASGLPFITMEYLAGETLREWMQRTMSDTADCPYPVAAGVIDAILDGLDAAHRMGVVHRDLKPENVFLTSDPAQGPVRLKLLDFGIAGVAEASAASSGASGTQGYMAPEQINKSGSVKQSADVHTVCVMFYELLVGVLPAAYWQSPSQGRGDVPDGIDAVIQAGLRPRARERPQNAAELRAAIGQAAKKPEPPKVDIAAVVQAGHALIYADEMAKAREQYRIAAEAGDRIGMERLAMLLHYGKGGPVDAREARAWYEKSIALGYPRAMLGLGDWFYEGMGGTPDLVSARASYLQAAKADEIVSQAKLGHMMLKGEGGPRDPAGAREWLEKSNFVSDRAAIGRLYAKGDGVARDMVKAREWFEKGARGGDADAKAELARLDAEETARQPPPAPPPKPAPATTEKLDIQASLKRAQMLEEKGRRTVMSKQPAGWREMWDEAHELYKKLVATGDVASKVAYARYLDQGAGGAWPAKYDVAKLWYEAAAKDGSAEAKYWLGAMYHNGRGIPVDRRKACELWEQAGDGGYTQGYMSLGVELRGQLAGSLADPPRARVMFERGARRNDLGCMVALAVMLAEGQGGPKDLKAAKEWFLKAKALDDTAYTAERMKDYF